LPPCPLVPPLVAIADAGKAKATALTRAAIDFDLMLPFSLSLERSSCLADGSGS
jgi:hypothetical protein